jgi:chromosome segregation protein
MRGAEISQGLQVSSARREAAQKQLQSLQERAERLAVQREQLGELDESQGELLAASLEQASEHEAMLDQRLAEVSHQSDLAQASLGPVVASAQQAQTDLSDTTAKLEALQGLQASLEAQDKTQPWLESHGLQSLAPVSSKLQVQARAALAVEAALRDALHARRVERLDMVAGLLQDNLPARVGFVAPSAGSVQQDVDPVPSTIGLDSLKSMASSSDPAIESALQSWLHGCFWANDLNEALSARKHLAPGARIFTAQGHAVDHHSVRSYAAEDARDGVLQRRSQIENLEKQSRAQRLLSEQARSTALQAQAQAAQLQEQTRALRDEHAQALRILGDRRLAMEAFSQKVESARAARQRLQADEQEVEQASAALEQSIQVELERFDALDAELAMHQEQAEQLRDSLLQAQQQQTQAAERLRTSERAWRDAQFTVRELQTTQQRLDSDRTQREAALEQARSELAQVQTTLDESVDLGLREQLQQALEAQSQAQSELAQARARMDEAQSGLRSALEERSRYEQAQEPVRALLQSLALEQQAARLAAEQYVLQLNETEFDEGALLSSFGEVRPRASQLQAELARSMQGIAALGAVNLAALDELAQVQERQEFLSAQAKDLNEAISTLEDAIRRIDRETRELLQSTYDTVNRQFGTLFPELFGGGEARLVLTGDEILDSGIQVMAHPPGKRNASIHLLSGGEKALTAIALVFALFQLNPAPFCLLDEVDAPLDDANTERYCDMVRRMSDHTQFLFITHNKIAMELAQQLIGVTMQERGVSRIVAVDLEAASSFAQAA